MSNKSKTAIKSKFKRLASNGGSHPKAGAGVGCPARQAYRAKIESLLDKSRAERLARVWQRVCPFPVDLESDLPDRRGIIKDLADFAEVLRPNLEGMKAHCLCRLIENYAAC